MEETMVNSFFEQLEKSRCTFLHFFAKGGGKRGALAGQQSDSGDSHSFFLNQQSGWARKPMQKQRPE